MVLYNPIELMGFINQLTTGGPHIVLAIGIDKAM